MPVQCELCPKYCIIAPGQSGDCRVRINVDGVLRTVVYGYPATYAIDPIEKKPMFHFLPGTAIFSLATVGCNLHCKNCQNWEISQTNPEDSSAYVLPPQGVVDAAIECNCLSVAYTYTDPVIYYEYACDTARIAREHGLRNIMVTAGYINPVPWKELLQYTDGAQIDLKSIRDEFYREVCSATLKPVLNALVMAREHGIVLEVSNLVIPTLNDSEGDLRDLSRWIKENLGGEIPLHFLGFHPRHKMTRLPPTPGPTLELARDIAVSEGMKHVYIGNLLSEKGQNTYCPGCGALLVERRWHIAGGQWRNIAQYRLQAGRCPDCNITIYGVWQ